MITYDIPQRWQTLKLRQILRPYSEKNHPELPLLSVVREKGVIVRNTESKEENHNYIPEDLSGYKRVKAGQFAMNKMKAWQGSYGISKYEGIVSPAYFVFDVITGMNLDFFNLAIRSKVYVSFFGRASDGIRVGQWDLSIDRMKEIPFFVPPREEQDQIVRFLDWKVSEINRLINIKRKEIERLEELKKTVVSNAVINPDWKTVPLKRCLLSIADIDHYMPPSVDSGFPYVMTGDLKPNTSNIDFARCKQIAEEDFISLSKKSKPERDNVIFARYATIGTVCYVDIDADFLVSYSCVTLKPNSLILGKYLFYYLKSNAFAQDLNKYIKVNTQGNVGMDSIRRAQIYLPTIEEQESIVCELDNSCSQINLMIENTKKQIQQLHEFKTRLISDVVTGKIDVRGIEIPEYEYTAEVADTDSEAEAEEFDEQEEV